MQLCSTLSPLWSGSLSSVEKLLSPEWLLEHYKRNAVYDVEMRTLAD
jgi:hypothetical protein